jgi:hypothetical protein
MGHVAPRRHSRSARLPRGPDRPAPQIVALISRVASKDDQERTVPNGNPDFDPKAAEQWFAPIAGVLESFAQRHNLLVDRYYHDTPSWTFRFNHPRGGQASLGVSCDAGETASIYSSWHVDDYDRFTRSIHWRKSRKDQPYEFHDEQWGGLFDSAEAAEKELLRLPPGLEVAGDDE